MADPKGIYFAPNNQGFATILPDRRDPNVFDYVERGMMQKAAQKRREEDQRRKDLEDIKVHDTYRYYLPAANKMVNEIIDYTKDPNHDPVERKRMTALYTQLSQAQMQMKDFDEVTFKEYEQDARINDTAKVAYIKKYRNNPTLEGLKQAAETAPDKGWFLDEVGGSEHLNKAETMKKVVEGQFADWLSTTKEGESLLRGRFGDAILQWSQEQKKSKAKAFARYDEKTGTVVAMNPDELIAANVLDAFQSDPYANRIIEDEAIARHEAQGLEGPVSDITRAEVLKDILDPYAATGEVEDKTQYTQMRDSVNYGRRDAEALSLRLYQKFEGLMDKKALPGERDPVFRGMEYNDYKVGDVVVEDTGTFIEYEEKVPDPRGGFTTVPKKERMTMDIIYKLFPKDIAAQFEKIARENGRIDYRGDFKTFRNERDNSVEAAKENQRTGRSTGRGIADNF